MRNLYFRIYLVVIASLFIAYGIGFYINDPEWRRLIASDATIHSQGIRELIDSEIRNNPSDPAAAISHWNKKFGYELALMAKDSIPLTPAQKLALSQGETQTIISYQGFRNVFELYLPLSSSDKILYMYYLSGADYGYEKIGWVNMAVFLIVVACAVFLLTRPLKRHLERLVSVCESYAVGEFEERAENINAPFNKLALTLAKMADKISRLLNEQNAFSSTISHELRTPIARLRLALDLTRNIHSVEELRDQIQDMDADIDQLDNLVKEILSYSYFANAESKTSREKIQLEANIKNIVNEMASLKANININVNCACQILVADSNMLNRAISNLLANAQRYANTEIKITSYETTNSIDICIDDDGPGIPDKSAQSIFQPFFRISHHDQDQGYGLGLSIVQRIMEKHSGQVTVSTSQLGGARFTLKFPRLDSSGASEIREGLIQVS